MNLLTTYGLGSFDPTSPEKLAHDREVRYRHLFDLADAYLSRGLSLWVDGNFPRRAWRSEILGLARRYAVSEVAAIQCFCSVPELLEERFRARREDPDQPDAQANDISAYHGSVSHFEPVTAAEFNDLASWELLEYDSCRKILKLRKLHSHLGSGIHRQMLACGFLTPA
jgi:predicted kinase